VVAAICRRLRDEEGITPGRMLVLLRSNPRQSVSTPFVKALEEVGLNAELPSDPFAVLDDDKPREVVCILRLLDERGDSLAWRELLKLRDNGLGDGSLMAVYALADERGLRYGDALSLVADEPGTLTHPRRNRIAEEVKAIEDALDELHEAFEQPPADGLAAVLDAVDLREPEQRKALQELLLSLPVELESGEEGTLRDVAAALLSSRGAIDEAQQGSDPDRVQIMTMHSAKGLTADVVFVAACDDELVPGATDDRRDLDDQRRLLYVSLTRARKHLYVTYSRWRARWESEMLRVPQTRHYTRFLRDYVRPDSPARG
jgi:DNA helicase II / ATP-dependent DNA helicase PcrA